VTINKDIIKHKINIQHNEDIILSDSGSDMIRQAIQATLQREAVDMLCVVNVLASNDEMIREYNREYRHIDKATDVLSFPMQTFLQAGWSGLIDKEVDEDTGDLPLGDIIFSIETAKKQAEEYGNSVEYEIAYLMIHSTLHLLGYDHKDENSEKVMHKKNKSIIQEMGFTNNDQ